jgi:hypothetical protein
MRPGRQRRPRRPGAAHGAQHKCGILCQQSAFDEHPGIAGRAALSDREGLRHPQGDNRCEDQGQGGKGKEVTAPIGEDQQLRADDGRQDLVRHRGR